MKKLNEDYKEPNYEDVIQENLDEEFQIGQAYENIPARSLECKKCGYNKFTVGTGSYYTAIKCPKCLWELCIHNG